MPDTDEDKHGATLERSHLLVIVGSAGSFAVGLATGLLSVVTDAPTVTRWLGGSWLVFVALFVGLVFAIMGAALLLRHRRPPLGGPGVTAIIMITIAALAFGWATGHLTKALALPATPQPSTTAVSVEIDSPQKGATVQQQQQVMVKVTGGRPDLRVWIGVRGENLRMAWPQGCVPVSGPNTQLIPCEGTFGDLDASRGHRFILTAFLVDRTGHDTLVGLQNQNGGRGVPYNVDDPPFRAVVQSNEVPVQRAP